MAESPEHAAVATLCDRSISGCNRQAHSVHNLCTTRTPPRRSMTEYVEFST